MADRVDQRVGERRRGVRGGVTPVRFKRTFKLARRNTPAKGEKVARIFVSRLVDPQSSIATTEGPVTRYGETNTGTSAGNEITVLFAISYRLLHAG